MSIPRKIAVLMAGLLVAAPLVGADQVNTVPTVYVNTANGNSATLVAAPGEVIPVTIWIDDTGRPGCDPADGSAAVVQLVAGYTNIVLDPASVSFDACGQAAAKQANVVVSEDATAIEQWVQFEVIDARGTYQAATTGKFKLAIEVPTPPVAIPTITPVTSADGWSTTDVVVSWTLDPASDAGWDLSECQTVTVAEDVNGLEVSCIVKDLDGNVLASQTVLVYRDATPPTIDATLPAANANGWYNGPVVVSYVCADALSGIATCSGDETLSTEGAVAYAGAATDVAGNAASTSGTVNIDLTPPTVGIESGGIGLASSSSYYWGELPAFACASSDELSGISGECTLTGHSSAVGTHTLTATVSDNAGNTASSTMTYTVLAWKLGGFYSPVSMKDLNTVKAGSTVPLKFNIWTSSEQTSTSAIASLAAYKTTCATGLAEDPVDQTATGGTSLRYDTVGGQFIFNWQTPKAPGTCWSVRMTAVDGSVIQTAFKLK